MAFVVEKKLLDLGYSRAVVLPIEQVRNLTEVGVVVLDMAKKEDREMYYKFREAILARES